MFDSKALFKERLSAYGKLLNRYLRYLFNGHFMIAVLFLIITLAIYYQQWLKSVGDEFPASIVIALILGFAVSYNPIQSFLKEPDKVFLMVKERELYRYFRYTLLYNYVVQLYIVAIALAVIGPLYLHMYPHNGKLVFVLIVLLMLVLKGWNFIMNWFMFRIRNRKTVIGDKVFRTLFSIGIFYFLLEKSFFMILVALLYFGIVFYGFSLAKKQSGLAWDVLIENDQHRIAVFYRFVSNFAEVPQLTKRMKKRRVLARFVERTVSFLQSETYAYLYRLTFIRSSDYLNLYVRLTVIGAIIMYFIPNTWLNIALALLFIYMTSFQLIPLFHHYRTSVWLDLYPVKKEIQQQAFLHDMRVLTGIQAGIFSLVFLATFDWTGLIITIVASGLFTYLFYNEYVKRKIA